MRGGRPLIAAICVGSAVGVFGQTPVFRGGTSAVTVDVSVKNRAGRVVTGLAATDFVVEDNGVAQEISAVSYGKAPIDVTIALDSSFSVTGPLLDELRRSVATLMRDLRQDDRLKLMAFNSWIIRTVDFTNDVAQIERALRAVTAGGGTSLYDALSVALTSATDPDRRQLVVVFTDGTDTSSTTSAETIAQIADRTRATVSFVVLSAFRMAPTPTGVLRQVQTRVDPTLSRLATNTGGAVFVASSTDLGLTFLRALDAFRTTYVLHYSPRGVDRGGFHTITVKVNRGDAVVQARRGYFGGQ